MAQHLNIPFLKLNASGMREGDVQIDRHHEQFWLDDIARHMLYNSDQAMGIISQNNTWLAVNHALSRLLGTLEHKLVYNKLSSTIDVDEWNSIAKCLQELKLGGTDLHEFIVKLSGKRAKLKLSVIRNRNREALYYLLEVKEVEKAAADIALFPSRTSEAGRPALQRASLQDNKKRVIDKRKKSLALSNLKLYRGGKTVYRSNIPIELVLGKESFLLGSKSLTSGEPYWNWNSGKLVSSEDIAGRLDKLSAVRQLAAGIAHEIRNPLTSVKGFVQLMKTRNQVNSAYLEVMDTELERIQQIISDFLLMANPAKSPYPLIDIHGILAEICMRLNVAAAERQIQLTIQAHHGPLIVRGDQEQLMQAFMHIVQNGLDAIAEDGQLAIYAERKAGQVVIRIEDNGRGISSDRLARLGEPYFVSHEKGSGFGLMVSFTIIEAHSGTVRINSLLNKGTVVEVSLPLEGF